MTIKNKIIITLTTCALLVPTGSFADTTDVSTPDNSTLEIVRELRAQVKNGDMTKEEFRTIIGDMDLPEKGTRELTEDQKLARQYREQLKNGEITREEFQAFIADLNLPERTNKVKERVQNSDMQEAKALRETYQAGNITREELREALSELNLPNIRRNASSENGLMNNPFSESMEF